jgi:Spy/CpxP family protein refolding chaperone
MNQEILRKARLWLGLVFVLGAAIGAVFGYSFGHGSYAATRPTPPTLSEPERRAKRVAEMTKELGLTGEQSAKMDEIIRGAHQEMKTIHDKADTDVDVVRQKARQQMREFLAAEQKPKFDAMVQRMDEERKKQQAQQGTGK